MKNSLIDIKEKEVNTFMVAAQELNLNVSQNSILTLVDSLTIHFADMFGYTDYEVLGSELGGFAVLDHYGISFSSEMAKNILRLVELKQEWKSELVVGTDVLSDIVVDNGLLNQQIAYIVFLLNQEDKFFDYFKGVMAGGEVGVANAYYHYLTTGDLIFSEEALDNFGSMHRGFHMLKNPIWSDVIEMYMESREYNGYYEDILAIDGKLPIPDVKFGDIKLDSKGSILYSDYAKNGGIDSIKVGYNDKDIVNIDQHLSDSVIKLYIGYFGRAPEYQGFEYQKQQLLNKIENGYSENEALNELSNEYFQSAISMNTGYSDHMSEENFIKIVYSNVLGRPNAYVDDKSGVDYWVEVMSKGGFSRGEMVVKIIDSANQFVVQNPDLPIAEYVKSITENRLEVSYHFAKKSVSGDLVGEEALEFGRMVINKVDHTQDSVNSVLVALRDGGLDKLPDVELNPPSVSNDYKLTSEDVSQIMQLYIGYFGRLPEYSGFEHYKTVLIEGVSSGKGVKDVMKDISSDFYINAIKLSSLTGYDELVSDTDFVLKVYGNVMGRKDVDLSDEGVLFWVKSLEGGESRSDVVLSILSEAKEYIALNPNDEVSIYVNNVFQNKEDVGFLFASEKVSGNLNIEMAYQKGVELSGLIDDTPDSVKVAKQNIVDFSGVDLVGVNSLSVDVVDFV